MRARILGSLAALGALSILVVGSATGALWSSTQNVGAGTIPTGTVTIVNGDTTTQSHDYDFAALAGSNMAPGSYAQAPLVVKNAGTAPIDYYLSGWTATDPLLQDNLILTVTVAPTPSSCTPDASPQPGTSIDPGTPRPLASDSAENLCIRLTLSTDAPQQLSGDQTANQVTFTFRGDQSLDG